MNPFLSFVLRTLIAIPTAGIVWLISFFGYDQSILFSTTFAIAGGLLIYLIAKTIMKHRFLKSQGLTRREYKYIEKNLNEAKRKIDRLNKALFSLKQLTMLKQNLEILRITRKIYRITKKEPKRFYLAERFYFYHLDSFVELAEKYSFLSAQPTKNLDLRLSLQETRKTIEEMRYSLEKDLDQVLSNDLDQLNLELDVAKRNINTIQDESRRLK
ncbi:5-bromo-4-chloroindolyl phosphate hydrolysis family protein [Robertmurraya sp. Marseille-Q9965]